MGKEEDAIVCFIETMLGISSDGLRSDIALCSDGIVHALQPSILLQVKAISQLYTSHTGKWETDANYEQERIRKEAVVGYFMTSVLPLYSNNWGIHRNF
jgi:hypothetical protein